jgi:glycosyltransferase involved in cell wall biosynthesis
VRILVLSKRQYTNKDLLDDKYGRIREIPLELGRLGHTVTGLCLSYRWKPQVSIQDETVTWHSYNATISGFVKYVFQACQTAANSNIIIASSDSIFGIFAFLIAGLHNIPLIFDLYDNYEFFLLARIPIIKQVYKWVLRKSDGVTCVSRPLARLIKSYGRKKPMIVLENAVCSEVFRPLNMRECRKALHLPEKGRLIGTAGALHPNRGISVLFDAFEQLKAIYPDLYLVLAGPRQIDLPNEPQIIYLGNLTENKVPFVFNALNVVVICNTENEFGKYCFPQKTREIMACNRPLVAANIGAMRDIFSGYPQGWLFQPNDTRDLAKAIALRLKDKRTNYVNIKTWREISVEFDKFIKFICKVYRGKTKEND